MSKTELVWTEIRSAQFDFDELQYEAGKWHRYNFGDEIDSSRPLLVILEELGELAHAHTKILDGIRGDNHIEKKKDAIGDIVIALACYCDREGIDMQECVENVWKEVRTRDWKKYPRNGKTE